MTTSSKAFDKRFHLTWGTLFFFLLHLGVLLVFVVKVDWVGLAMMVGLFLVRTFSITAGFHRYFSHHSFKTNRFFQFCLAFMGGTCAQKGVLWWVAHHRHHHQHSDTERDIHSAKLEGFYWAHLGWMLSREYHDSYDPKAVKDWTRFPELVWLDKNHLWPPVILAVVCFAAYGWVGLVWGFIMSTVLLYHATFSINSICHMFGSRRYETKESSRNTWWLSLYTLGENWHNNHHQYPRSSRHGFYWWEVDITYYALKILSLTGVIHDLKVVSESALPQPR